MTNKSIVKKNILNMFSILRGHPKSLLCGENNYYTWRTFIEGYFYAIDMLMNIDISKKITIWLSHKYGKSTAIPFFMYPEYFHPEISDIEKKNVLMSFIEEFLEESF